MSARDDLYRKMCAAGFAVWDMHLYLDSHPDDKLAAQKLSEYLKQSTAARVEYEKAYGPVGFAAGTPEQWVKGPWPWEYTEGEA